VEGEEAWRERHEERKTRWMLMYGIEPVQMLTKLSPLQQNEHEDGDTVVCMGWVYAWVS